MELRDLRQEFRNALSGMYSDSELDAMFYILMEDLLGFPRHILGLEPQKSLTTQEANKLNASFALLKKGIPLQYVLGKSLFLDLDLEVGPGVLIPRPETEELVLWIVDNHKTQSNGMRILDVGTGSGCIPIGLKKNMSNAELHGLDSSIKALDYSRKNADIHNVEILWHETDMGKALNFEGAFDLVVSNPPYIPLSEAQHMHANVRDFEPSEALFVPDNNPLIFYRHLMELCKLHLKIGGWLYLEIHERFGTEVSGLLHSNGYTDIFLKRDIFGKPRFVRGRKQ